MRRGQWLFLIGSLLLGGYLSSGLTILQPDEVGVVRRLGAVLPEPWEPGLHWGLPWGFDRVNRLKVNQTRHDRRGCVRLERGADLPGTGPGLRRFLDRRLEPGHGRGPGPIPRAGPGRLSLPGAG